MNVSELIEEIGFKRNLLNQMYSQYKEEMVKLAELKQQLKIMLDESGLRSAKSTNFGVSIVSKPNILIQSEQSIKEWLENTPNIESDAYIGLKLTPFKSFATDWYKKTGEIITGTDIETSESISIRNNSK
jgi:pantothenate kinase type III